MCTRKDVNICLPSTRTSQSSIRVVQNFRSAYGAKLKHKEKNLFWNKFNALDIHIDLEHVSYPSLMIMSELHTCFLWNLLPLHAVTCKAFLAWDNTNLFLTSPNTFVAGAENRSHFLSNSFLIPILLEHIMHYNALLASTRVLEYLETDETTYEITRAFCPVRLLEETVRWILFSFNRMGIKIFMPKA